MRNGGALPYDDEIDYLQWGHCTITADEYVCNVANGPASTVVSPADAGQTTWERVAGEINLPSRPSTPAAVVANSQITWTWNCPLDGGAAIDHFDFQWRIAGGNWSATIETTIPRYILTGLTNGSTYQARVRASNSQGDSPWSAFGSGDPVASVPGGGGTLALRALAGDTEVDLTWLEPDTGGDPIDNYTVQWRTTNQGFSSGRQATSNATSYTRTGLTNGTEYFFRVRANNGSGSGLWSNEDSATPVMGAIAQDIPDRADAPTGQAGNGEVTWVATPPSDNGSDITSYQWRWRVTKWNLFAP